MELPILKDTGRKIVLNSNIFDIEPNTHVVYLDVKNILANKRQGTHKAKERCEITGSTRKLRKQKGTGNARVGDIKSPLFKGGGRVFGPKPRDYGFKLNKKTKKLARKSVLSDKAKEQKISVLENFNIATPKTKECIKMLSALSLQGVKSLIICDQIEKNLVLASRNIPATKVVLADLINTYDVLNASRILISEEAVKKIEKNLA